MRPTSGGRVVLERADAGPGEVAYRAELLTADGAWRATARVAADGSVGFSAWQPPDAPAWLAELARAFLRVEWRARQRPDPAPWPARINRWRAG